MSFNTRILFAAQNSSFPDFFETFVSHPSIELFSCEHYDSAVQRIKKEKFDIIVFDQELKNEGVYNLLDILKKHEEIIPFFIVLFTDSSEKNLVDLYSNGIHALIPKPILNLSFAYQLNSLSKMVEMRKKNVVDSQAISVIDALEGINSYLHKDLKQACERGLTRVVAIHEQGRNNSNKSESTDNELIQQSMKDYATMLALVNAVGEEIQNIITHRPSELMNTITNFDDLYKKHFSLVEAAYSVKVDETR